MLVSQGIILQKCFQKYCSSRRANVTFSTHFCTSAYVQFVTVQQKYFWDKNFFLQRFASCERVKGEESMEEKEGEHVSRFSHEYVAHDSAMHDSNKWLCAPSAVFHEVHAGCS
jgi:hypothetical protein